MKTLLFVACLLSISKLVSCQNIGKAVFLTDDVNKTGAMCLDGTPGLYYIAQNSATTKYLIYFQGGGWCSGLEQSNGKGFNSCFSRRGTSMGSTKGDGSTKDLNNEFGMGTNKTINPTMYDWNHIFVRYCDGGSFSGNRNDPVYNNNNVSMYFRGKRIMDAVINSLKTDYGLDKATDIVISGGSAGGLATFVHTNYISSMINLKETKMVSLPNVGFFLEYNGYNGNTNYSNGMKWIYNNMNVSSSIIDPQCFNNNNLMNDECIFPQNIAGDNLIPTFIFNSQYDAWQVNNILGTNNVQLVNEYGFNFTNLLINKYLNNNYIYSAYINSCCYHDGDSNTYWYGLNINGKTPANAFDQFYNALDNKLNQTYFWFNNITYPCSNCCPSGEPQTCHYYDLNDDLIFC